MVGMRPQWRLRRRRRRPAGDGDKAQAPLLPAGPRPHPPLTSPLSRTTEGELRATPAATRGGDSGDSS
uniref:Uncharacterized protein n=1 Tax=Aegilops tauschii TaxID=37682 RepID=N1QV13_AEGTA